MSIDNLTVSYTQSEPGLYCNDHRSSWCEHCIEAYANNEDAMYLSNIILLRSQPSNPSDMIYVTIPIFSQFCVWENIAYDCRIVEPFGAMAVLDPGLSNPTLRVIARIMPGESARSLQLSLLQDFEDEFDLILEKSRKAVRSRADAPAWRCSNSAHSLRYQQLVEATVSPSKLAEQGNTEIKQAMIYCFTRWKMCLFCKVNKHSRDAVRVNPAMLELFGQDGVRDPNSDNRDFSDLVPN